MAGVQVRKGKALWDEFELIARIRRRFPANHRNLLLGIGDDAAAFRLAPGGIGLSTIDTLVDGVHFDRRYGSYYDIGWKAMAANLSDIAAMGGRPLLALVSLTLTRSQRKDDIDQLYSGMGALAERFRVAIAGGDLVCGQEFSITIAVVGEGGRRNLGTRSGARPGDAVLVTGTLGDSAAGLDLLRSQSYPGLSAARGGTAKIRIPKFFLKHLRPEPRVAEALILARNADLHGMIDISDGLSSELWHLSRESRVAIVVDQGALPLGGVAVEVSRLLGKDPLEYCLHGGEEYELLFTLAPPTISKVRKALAVLGTPCRVIGQVAAGRGVWLVDAAGRRQALRDGGYKHRFDRSPGIRVGWGHPGAGKG